MLPPFSRAKHAAPLLDSFTQADNEPDLGDHRGGAPVVNLRGVVKTYSGAAGAYTALKGLDLQVAQGEFLAIVGKSGSGKSTLLNMITGIDRPTSGTVDVCHTPVHTLGESQLARWRGRNLGIVFQFFQLLPTLSLIENVMLPMDFANTWPARERRGRAEALLQEVGMLEHARKLPSAVSGGQQQRVAIARALANNPPLLITDEPTGNLDSRSAEAVFELFERLVERGHTVLIVTHDEDLAERADRIVVIADGQLVESKRGASRTC